LAVVRIPEDVIPAASCTFDILPVAPATESTLPPAPPVAVELILPLASRVMF